MKKESVDEIFTGYGKKATTELQSPELLTERNKIILKILMKNLKTSGKEQIFTNISNSSNGFL